MQSGAAEQASDVQAEGPGRPATSDDLRNWVEKTTGGSIIRWEQIAGGNRCQSWAVDVENAARASVDQLYLRYQVPRPPSAEPYTVWREAKFYQALKGSAVPAPQLVAVHPETQVILTERVRGRADYRRIGSDAEKEAVAREFIHALVTLHRIPLRELAIPGLQSPATIADCVRQELAIWQAMYDETLRRDPLIDLALEWLSQNVPSPSMAPVLVHGDAGQGNFLFEAGHLTALLDWELAHVGDPIEDLAWFSMRSVMEPAPNFAGLIEEYGRLTGEKVDIRRLLYYRVFVSLRVVIIRHRNVTGFPGNSIVSRALNRRLLVEALAAANGIELAPPRRIDVPPTDRTPLYDTVIHDLQHEIADVTDASSIVAAAKNLAKVLKYLREVDRLSGLIEEADLAALTKVLGARPVDVETGKADVLSAARAGKLSFADALQCFAELVARESQLAAPSSGGLAVRHFPPLPAAESSDA